MNGSIFHFFFLKLAQINFSKIIFFLQKSGKFGPNFAQDWYVNGVTFSWKVDAGTFVLFQFQIASCMSPSKPNLSYFPHPHLWLKERRKKRKKVKATKKKKKPYFMGGRTCQVGSVGRATFFLFSIFLFYGSKKWPKNTKILRKLKYFLQKNFRKIFRLIFKKFQPNFSDLSQKMADFTRFGGKNLGQSRL